MANNYNYVQKRGFFAASSCLPAWSVFSPELTKLEALAGGPISQMSSLATREYCGMHNAIWKLVQSNPEVPKGSSLRILGGVAMALHYDAAECPKASVCGHQITVLF